MESQRWSDEIDKRRSLLQSDALKITIASDLPALQLPANTQPIIRGLQREMDVLAGLQFNDHQAAGTRHREEIENAVFVPRIGKNLGVDEALIEHGIDARDVLADDRFQPALRLRAVERMARIVGQRVTMNLQIMEEMLQSGPRSGSELLTSVVDSEKNVAIIPTREREATIPQPHFAGLRRGMQSHGLRRDGDNGIQRRAGLLLEPLRFAMRDEPGIQVTRAPGIDLFDDVQRGVVLVNLHGELRVECRETVCYGAASFPGKNDANADNRLPAARFARTPQPEKSEGEAFVDGIR